MRDDAGARMIARITLGRALQDRRLASGLSGDEVARRLAWSQSKVSRIEAAQTRAEVDDVLALLDLYSVRGQEADEIRRLAETAAGPASEWRNSTRVGLTRRQQDFIAFESSASSILHHQPTMIPGPMQTRAYAERVLAMAGHPDPERAVEVRMARRSAIFRVGGPQLEVVLSEAAVHWNPGPGGVLDEQLRTMAALVEEHGTSLRVVPMDREQRNFLGHPAVIYGFADGTSSALVETTTLDIRVTDADEIEGMSRRIRDLADVGLTTDDSIAYVRRIAKRLPQKGHTSEQ